MNGLDGRARVSGSDWNVLDESFRHRGISGTIEQVNEIAIGISAVVEEQGAATSKIAHNVQEPSRGTSEVTNSMVAVSLTASETGVAAWAKRLACGEFAGQSETSRQEMEASSVEIRGA